MNKEYIKNFIENHKEEEISPAKIEYICYKMPDYKDFAAPYLDDSGTEEVEGNIAEEIKNAGTASDMLALMRKSMSSGNRNEMRKKLLDFDKELYPLIQAKALRSMNDIFIENATYYFLRCGEDPTSWIKEAYDNFNSDYMRSMLCLVTGMRGDAGDCEWLASEADRMERDYPDELFDQGPLIALKELINRQ